MCIGSVLMISYTFGLDSLHGEHQAVCSWKPFCGLARCLSALPGTRPQWGLGLKFGGPARGAERAGCPSVLRNVLQTYLTGGQL